VFAAAGALAVFVIPHWTEFQFYNWQMTVTRKPEYTLEAFQDRVSWLPLAHGVFTRMWFVLLAASVAAAGIVARWRSAAPAERLAVLWLLVGLAELLVHDSGNERRYVMFVPGLVALAGMAMSRTITAAQTDAASGGVVTRVLVGGTVAGLAYLVIGSALRLVWLERVLANDYSLTVQASAALALLVAAALLWRWPAWKDRLTTHRLPFPAALAVVVLTCGTDLTLYGQWAGQRTFDNVEASRALATRVPPRTLVHGKLANGLSLENQIAPLFVGRGFGNYADRLERDDARYILTYTQPRLGFEGPVILDVLQHYPGQRVIAEFDVDETPGADRAALIDKFPDRPESRARHQ
jgi:hypothetical protein